MALAFSLGTFPVDGRLKDSAGVPFGIAVAPFANVQLEQTHLPNANDVARCEECLAYVSGYCCFERHGWICALCGAMTAYQGKRYTRAAERETLPELQHEVYEAEVEEDGAEGVDDDGAGGTGVTRELVGHPAYVALVDVSVRNGASLTDVANAEAYLEVVRSALLASVEALDDCAVFGVATFDGTSIGLCDLGGEEEAGENEEDGDSDEALQVAPFQPSVRVVPLSLTPDSEHASALAAIDSPSAVPLADAVPLTSFLAHVGTQKERIIAAVECLRVAAPPAEPRPQRAFGAALEALAAYWAGAAPHPKTLFGCRVSAFLSGAPDAGRGALDALDAGEGDATATAPSTARERSANATRWLMAPVDGFYAQLGASCARARIAVDVHCIVPASQLPIGIAALDSLACASGGHVRLYAPDAIADAAPDSATHDFANIALPRDLYRHLAAPVAVDGTLRVRTSPEFKAARGYGASLAEDTAYDGVFHLPRAMAADTVCFDFEYTDRRGFARDEGCPPMVQLAFQYTAAVPVNETAENGDGGPPRRRRRRVARWQRRLRVRTVQAAASNEAKDVLENVNAPVVLALLHHKISRAVADEGLEEGRLLLRDWLVILAAHYNAHYGVRAFGTPSEDPGPVDCTFAECPALASLPRIAYAMLEGPLLRRLEKGGGEHPDARAASVSLMGRIPPALLARLVYPALSSYASPDELALPKHSLSRSALKGVSADGSEPPCIFVLDAITEVAVLYTEAADAKGYALPPPGGSLVRKRLAQWRNERPVAPRVRWLRASAPEDFAQFERFLVEDLREGGGGLVGFLDRLAEDVRAFLGS